MLTCAMSCYWGIWQMDTDYSGRRCAPNNCSNWCGNVGRKIRMIAHSLLKLFKSWKLTTLMHIFMWISMTLHQITYSHRPFRLSLGNRTWKRFELRMHIAVEWWEITRRFWKLWYLFLKQKKRMEFLDCNRVGRRLQIISQYSWWYQFISNINNIIFI